MTTDNVLILDADTSYHIDIIHSLVRNGITVHAADTGSDFPFSKYSRFVASRDQVGVPDPSSFIDSHGFFGDPYFGYVSPDTYFDQLSSAIARRDVDILLPYREEHTIVLSSIADELVEETGVRIALPDHEDVLDATNKRRTMQRASEAGLSIPRSYYPEVEDDVYDVFEREETPVVAKPSFGRGSSGVRFCETLEEGLEAFRAIDAYSRPLFQEAVTGTKYMANTVANRQHEPVSSFVAQVHAMSSPEPGGSICSRSVKNDAVREQLLGLVDAFDWVGPASPEFIVDSETGEAKLMEINPRMFGHTTIAIRSGVEVPHLYYCIAADHPVEPIHDYTEDLLWIDPIPMLRTGKIRRFTVSDLLNRLVTGGVFQSEYLITDPVYSGLMLANDVKSKLLS